MAINKRTPLEILNKDIASIESIIKSINKSIHYSNYTSIEDFEKNEMAFDASVRQIEVIGEAVKRLSESIQKMHPEIEWSGLAKMRDVLIHQYDKVDSMILWDTIKKELPLEIPKLKLIKNELLDRKQKLENNKPKSLSLF